MSAHFLYAFQKSLKNLILYQAIVRKIVTLANQRSTMSLCQLWKIDRNILFYIFFAFFTLCIFGFTISYDYFKLLKIDYYKKLLLKIII